METTAVDKNGDVAATVLPITVGAQPTTTVSDIQDMSGWENCGRLSAQFDAPQPDLRRRPGRSRLHHDPEPVLARARGQISQVHHGWPTGYSNELYFKSLGGGTSVSHFTYDLYFYVDNPNAPQALEFDVNPTFGGTRWTWGTECNFNGSGKWDIWYPLNEMDSNRSGLQAISGEHLDSPGLELRAHQRPSRTTSVRNCSYE